MSLLFFAGRKQNKKVANVFHRRGLRLEELESRQLLSVCEFGMADETGYVGNISASDADIPCCKAALVEASGTTIQLPAPIFNAPTIGSTSVTMSWSNVANASGYELQWRLSTTGQVQGSQSLSGNTTTSFVVSGLLPATGYTFNVKAMSGSQSYSDSNWSFNYLVTTNSAGYTPGDDSPVAPVLITDAVYSTAATFHWSAVSGAVSYVLQYYAKYPVETEPVDLPYSRAGSYTVSGLEQGTQYVFTLWGIKADGSQTAHSFPVYVTTNSAGITVPIHIASPSLLTLETTGDTSASVMWSTVNDAASYVLQYSTNSAFKAGTVVSLPFEISNEPVTVDGLEAKTTYYFRVKAIPENVGTTDSYWSQWLSTTTWAVDQDTTTIWVTSAGDSETLNGTVDGTTLREAIAQAGTQTNCVIGFDDSLKGQTINLANTLFIENSKLTINATNLWDEDNDCPGITISGQGNCGVFRIGRPGVSPNVTLAGLSITQGNSQADFGGGVYLGTGTLTMLDCFVCENHSNTGGGGIYSLGTLSLTHCRISGNSVNDAAAGGGLYLGGYTVRLDNVEISGNRQGGVLVNGITSESVFNQCTIAGNTNTGVSGGVYVVSSLSELQFNNTIVANNQMINPTDQDVDPDIDSENTNSYTLNSCLVGTDPLFVAFNSYSEWSSTLWRSWNLALTGASPAIDDGDSSGVPLTLNVDLANIPRIVGYSVDMGAYEYSLPNVAAVGSEITTSQGCSILLDATQYCSGPGMATGLVYAWDINGDGITDRYGQQVWLSAPEVLWQGATFNVSLTVANADNAVSNPCLIRVNVQEIGTSVETVQTKVNNVSQIAKYHINVSSPNNVSVATWIIDWGDETESRVTQLARSLTVAHYYSFPGTFTARVQMIDINSKGAGVWCVLGTTTVSAFPANMQAVVGNTSDDESFLPDTELSEIIISDESESQNTDWGAVSGCVATEDVIDILALDIQKKGRVYPFGLS